MIKFTPDMIPDLERFLELYYHKILRVNLTTDTFEVVHMYDFEKIPEHNCLSKWLNDFADSNVHEVDREKFKRITDLQFLKDNICEEPIDFIYCRKFPHEKYFNSEFILLPGEEFDDNNMVCYLFVKCVDLLD